MNYRQPVLLDTTNFTASGTKKIDLDLLDPITRLTIIMWVTNTTYVPTGHPMDCLTSLEIVDGSEVICSLSGVAAQAMSYYDDGTMDGNELNYESGAKCKASVTLNFGRWLYDEMFALDPKKYNNLQLKITHNYALGGCSPASINIRVIADMFDEKMISPEGFLRSQEIFSYAPVASAKEYVDLPTEVPLRKLLIMNTNDNEEVHLEFEKVKIVEDEGKRVVFDCDTIDLLRTMEARYNRFGEYVSGRVGTAGEEFYLTQCKDIMFGIIGGSTTAAYYHGAWSGGRLRSLKGSATQVFGGHVTGRCPHGAVPIFFGKQDDPNDWWDLSRVGKAQAQITASSGPDTNKNNVVVGQFKQRY